MKYGVNTVILIHGCNYYTILYYYFTPKKTYNFNANINDFTFIRKLKKKQKMTWMVLCVFLYWQELTKYAIVVCLIKLICLSKFNSLLRCKPSYLA